MDLHGMKIIICGHGFVGKAHGLFLSTNHDISVYDPAKGYKDQSVFKNADAVIISVSTPEGDDGMCNMNNVYKCLELCNDVPILIKSTISLEGWELLNRGYANREITFSPEYLRAAHAFEDFKNHKSISIGGGNTNFWLEVLSNSLKVRVDVVDPKILILTKYFRNSYLAMKVAFFNQMHDMAKAAGVIPEELLMHVSNDERIGKSHTYVNEDDRGFGGHCFPKDTAALLHTANSYRYNLSILNEAVNYNKGIRNE